MSSSLEGEGRTEDENGFQNGPSGGPAVLVIEQTEATRGLMAQALEPDYRVDAVATYDQARRRAEETRYDGIVLSVYRHDVEAGVELMKNLRASARPGEVAVVLVVRSSFDRDSSSLLDAGFDDVMRMPFAKSALLDVVGRHVSVE
jgi:DNA-binding response OmpR family regulator